MLQRRFVLLTLGLLLSGCRGDLWQTDYSPPDVGGATGTTFWSTSNVTEPGIERASVFHLGTRVVIWGDFPNGGGTGINSNRHGTSCSGHFITADREKVEYSCETTDGQQGTVTIAGRKFDWQGGTLFLVAPDDTGWRVLQLQRNMEHWQFKPEPLKQIARDDAEIRAFFQKTE